MKDVVSRIVCISDERRLCIVSKGVVLKSVCLRSNPGSTAPKLCALGQVTYLLCLGFLIHKKRTRKIYLLDSFVSVR